MTPEEEFVARLTCISMSRSDIWVVDFDEGIIECIGIVQVPGRAGRNVTGYRMLKDVYITDMNKLMPTGTIFTFADVSIQTAEIINLNQIRNDS